MPSTKHVRRSMSNILIVSFFILGAVLTARILFAADGSGTNSVSPTSVTAESTGNTLSFTYTAAETMDSGEVSITVPSGWSTPQGSSGTAGYTTASSASGTTADIINVLDSTASWTATQHMVLSADTSDKQEGTASLSNAITTTAAANEQWYSNYGSASNWGTTASANNLRVGMYIKSSVNTASGDLSWQDDDTASLASPLDTIAIPALTANTWTYTSISLGATARASILSYGFRYTTDIGAVTVKADTVSLIFQDNDSNAGWTEDANITDSALTTSGNYVEGAGSVRCAYAAGAGIGASGECWSNENSALSRGPGTTISFWVRSSVALNAGDFAWIDDDASNLASPSDIVNLPALSANTWTYVTLSAPNSGTIRSFGVRQVVDKGAMNIDLDAIGKVIDAGDSTTGWTAPTAAVQTLSADTSVFHEGTASLKNVLTAGASSGDKWYQTFGSTQNWSGYTTVGFWIRSSANTSAGDLQFEYDDASDLSSPIASINIGALTADTWSFQKLTLSGARTSINSYGIKYVTNIGAASIYLDDVMAGPGSPTFSGNDIKVRILSLANTQTLTITYGSGGGSSGATAPSTQTSTFTTKSRVSDVGILSSIASSPTVTVNNPVPTTTSISPTSKTVGDSQFTMTVNGTNFVSTSVVRFNGSDRTTAFVNSTQLTATIPSTDLSSAGTFSITVFNPTPGGGTSNSQTFTVDAASDTTAPAAVTNLAVTSVTASSIFLSWTAPGDDGNSGTAATYDVRYSTSLITSANFGSATQATGEPAPSVAGSNETFTVTSLSASTLYYFALKTSDEVPNTSAISNVVSTTTVALTDTTSPADVTNLAVTSVTASSIFLSWTAPGDDGNSGTAATYDVRYSTSNITSGNFGSAAQATGEPTPSVAGSSESTTVSGLSAGTTYYFALKTTDESFNSSGISNVVSDTTSASPATPEITPAPSAVTTRRIGVFFSGRAYPNSEIEVLRKDTSAPNAFYLTVPLEVHKVSGDGSFELSPGALNVDEYFFALRAEDKDGRKTNVLAFSVDLRTTDRFELKDILMPPTIGLERMRIRKGDSMKMVGYASLGGKTEIEIDGKIISVVQQNDSGFYSFTTTTSNLAIGSHSARTRQIDKSGKVSEFSPTRIFQVSTLLMPRADFNSDNKVDITDWSIFLFRWAAKDQAVRFTADMNNDGKIDIQDFSIFLRNINNK